MLEEVDEILAEDDDKSQESWAPVEVSSASQALAGSS